MTAPSASFDARAQRALDTLRSLAKELASAEDEAAPALAALPREAQASARNLVHYVALRRVDLRALQGELSALGLSSLGRAEADVMGALAAVTTMLERALGQRESVRPPALRHPAAELRERARALFGDAPSPAVMVTMPSSAAHDPQLIAQLLEAGMHVMRINAAHDHGPALRAIVKQLRRAAPELRQQCRVMVDLPGPKLRTLGMEPGPRVLKLKPKKDDLGHVVEPAIVQLRGTVSREPRGEPGPGEIWVRAEFVELLQEGDTLTVIDARGKRRKLHVSARTGRTATCTSTRTVYLDEHTVLTARRGSEKRGAALPLRIQAREGFLVLDVGERLVLRGDRAHGQPARLGPNGETVSCASVACGLPSLVGALRPGHRVIFDDGKIETVVEEASAEHALLRVVRSHGGPAKLRAEKGINVPDTELALPALTEHDRDILGDAANVADLVALSFVRSADDVRDLHRALADHDSKLGVVLKIETQRGFEELPAILLEALKRPHLAIMIARGDLAVECGFERLAEVQEEMLWLCEAAHVPVIWATQVLETLAKEGHATRAEVTDAAMSERAECVMLNKGPYVVEAVRTLHDILARMRGHQQKKRSTLRPLSSPRFHARPRNAEA